jgi:hypothetical protein
VALPSGAKEEPEIKGLAAYLGKTPCIESQGALRAAPKLSEALRALAS